jgi:AcrR family transcriptional regulator
VASESTKDRLLDAAERLFAEHGFGATSLRQITAAARVNLASVHYHFGSKESLLAAVFQRRIGCLNERRLVALTEIEGEANGGRPDLEAVVRAFIEPALRMRYELGEAGNRLMRLIGRAHTDPDEHVQSIFLSLFDGILERFLPVFRRALPEVPEDEVLHRFQFMVGAMAHTLAWVRPFPSLGEENRFTSDPDLLLERLVRFAVAGMKASAEARERGRCR